MPVSHFRKSPRALAIVGALFAVGGTSSFAAAAEDTRVKIGVLTCAAGPKIGLLITSAEKIECTFEPSGAAPEQYYGRIRNFGLDIGVTAGSVIVWGVLAAQDEYAPGSLAGEYVGVSAEQTVVLGLGANLLVGGSDDSLVLQPLSVQAQAGLNLAVGVSRMVIEQR